MPTTYAHYRFGRDVLRKLPLSVREKINMRKTLYEIGVHGPDILFYYRPFWKNEVNHYGSRLHQWRGTDVFQDFFEKTQKQRGLEKEAVQVYIYGFLCHFALDRTCHPEVARQMEETGLSHAEIEAELDRTLMLRDGLDPLRFRPAGNISTDIKEAAVIQDILPEISVTQVREALRSTVFFTDMFVAPGRIKRGLVRTVFRLMGKSEEMDGLIINYHRKKRCRDCVRTLLALYRQAVDMAVEMIVEFDRAFDTGELLLDEKYNHTFGKE